VELRIRFKGGPLDGEIGRTDRLDPLKVFFEDRQRRVLVYVKDETDYLYDPVKSKGLTEKYDEAKERIMGGRPPASLKFETPEGEKGE
jgi:hypothetical protein